jgi:hypothetical protein
MESSGILLSDHSSTFFKSNPLEKLIRTHRLSLKAKATTRVEGRIVRRPPAASLRRAAQPVYWIQGVNAKPAKN